jgi:hypothetical protein
MSQQKRKVLLIMDNAPSQSVPNLSNVEIHFYPSELQHKATVMRPFAFLVPLVYSTVERDLSGNIRKNIFISGSQMPGLKMFH